MNRLLLFSVALAVVLPLSSAALAADPPPAKGPWSAKALAGQELWATMKTSEGNIVLRLFSKDAPKTVANFVGLASGEQEWRDPRTQTKSTARAYDKTIFHRVIPGFMIQGGDPTGSGAGEPGYVFADETSNGRKFDKVGLLAMANRGPGTNGMQWFITVSTPNYLDGKHTIFGEVVSGYDVVEKISKVPTGADGRDRPNTTVVLKSVEISDKLPKGGK